MPRAEKNGYFENTVIKEIYEKLKFPSEVPDYIGISSWKQRQKTNLKGEEIISHIQNEINRGLAKDVYLYTSASNLLYSYNNVPDGYYCNGIIRDIDIWEGHKNRGKEVVALDDMLNNSKVLPFDLYDGKWQYGYSNYWIVKTEIFYEYCEKVLFPALAFFQREDIKQQSPSWYIHSHERKKYPSYSFTLEGLFGAFLAHSNYSYSYIVVKREGGKFRKINITGYENSSLRITKNIPETSPKNDVISNNNILHREDCIKLLKEKCRISEHSENPTKIEWKQALWSINSLKGEEKNNKLILKKACGISIDAVVSNGTKIFWNNVVDAMMEVMKGNNEVAKRETDEPLIILHETPINICKIGIYLHENKFLNYASDRIRGEWLINNSEQKIEIWNPAKEYEIIIFHELHTFNIEHYGKIKILDICDPIWLGIEDDFLKLTEPIDAFIVPTERLKNELNKITDKKIYIIGDGHDFEHYKTRIENLHTERAKEVVWFGYAENAYVLTPSIIDCIKEHGLRLKVIAQKQNINSLDKADKFIKWDIATYIKEISKSDFAILPIGKNHKSDNKEITALLSGIPVAKNEEDIIRLIAPEERQKEMRIIQEKLADYDIKNRVTEYLDAIDEISWEKQRINKTSVYTAICGSFDKPRADIIVFTDYSHNKFKQDIMNAKIYKILSHKYFETKYSIWLDENIFLNVEPEKLIEKLGDNDIALLFVFSKSSNIIIHPSRNCIYKEYLPAKKRIEAKYHNSIDEQISNYRNEGMPADFGMAECGMLIRKHSAIVEEFNNRWWAEICRYSHRDQMSFPYVWWKMKDRIKIILLNENVRTHKYFRYVNH